MTVDTRRIEEAVLDIVEAIGEDPERGGLQDTPARVAAFWEEFIDFDCGVLDTSFESVSTDQMVVVSGIKVYSLCEHHLLPFSCEVAMGYITHDEVLGLSKFARLAEDSAHRLQLQERLVHQIADEIEALSGSPDVAVFAKGRHLCMVMRGIETEGTLVTSVVRGRFRESPQAREEFLRLAKV